LQPICYNHHRPAANDANPKGVGTTSLPDCSIAAPMPVQDAFAPYKPVLPGEPGAARNQQALPL
jgi:hypothetical protein